VVSTIGSHTGGSAYCTETKGFCDAVFTKDQKLIRGRHVDACHTPAVGATAQRAQDAWVGHIMWSAQA